jgi:cytochrome P450
MFHDPIQFMSRITQDYGDTVFFTLGPQKVYLLNHPDHIQEVLATHPYQFRKGLGLQVAKSLLGEGLLTSEGEFHMRQRRLAQPAFHKQRVNAYAKVMVDYGLQMRERWKEEETLDIHKEMMELTLAIVAKTLFGADLSREEIGLIGKSLHDAMVAFRFHMMVPFPQFMKALPLPVNIRFKKAVGQLDKMIYRIIGQHKEKKEDTGDLLSMLLGARDTETDGAAMTDTQLRDECMTILLAGHETTANALSWTWYLLSQNPEVEAKWHRELDEVLGEKIPTLEDVPRLPFTEKVLSESMRVLPPAWALDYQAVVSTKIGDYEIPAKAAVIMSQYLVHKDPRYYAHPERFDPEHFTPEAKASRPRFAYFPFGGGPRQCIGEPFAWMEGILLLATLAQRWKFLLVPGHPVEFYPAITLRPKYGIKMTFHKRK